MQEAELVGGVLLGAIGFNGSLIAMAVGLAGVLARTVIGRCGGVGGPRGRHRTGAMGGGCLGGRAWRPVLTPAGPGRRADRLASAIRIVDPIHRPEVEEAVGRSGGAVVTVPEDELVAAWRALGREELERLGDGGLLHEIADLHEASLLVARVHDAVAADVGAGHPLHRDHPAAGLGGRGTPLTAAIHEGNRRCSLSAGSIHSGSAGARSTGAAAARCRTRGESPAVNG